MPTAGATIGITPSSAETRRLEERAIPYYYRVDTANPIEKNWSYPLHQRGMDAWNYSYHALQYGALGGAAHPLTSQIGRFACFRIEGHLGREVSSAKAEIENLIAANNLPFAVRALLLAEDKTKIVTAPGSRYTDLHRLHYLLRQDAYYQLQDVVQFSGAFKQQVEDAVASQKITDSAADNDGPAVKALVAEKHAAVTAKAAAARQKLAGSFSAFRADSSWKTDVGDLMRAAGEFKAGLGKVVKTEFPTPFDALIDNTHILWLDWVDEIIKQQDDQAGAELLFANFLTGHPGLEHTAGVPRGGTFVLVYDTDKKVIADFMLDYYCCEATKPQLQEPPLAKPEWKPGWIVENGININPSLNKALEAYTSRVIEPKIIVQKDYINFFKDSMTTIANVLGNVRAGGITADAIKYTDPLLAAAINETKAKQQTLATLKGMAGDPGLPQATRDQYTAQVKQAETALATSIETTAQRVVESGQQVSPGSQGYNALLEMSNSMAVISDTTARTLVTARLNNLKQTARDPGMQVMLGSMTAIQRVG